MCGDRKSETNVHAARVALHRGIEEFFDFCEGHYLVELAPDLGTRHAEDRAVEIEILAAGEFRVETGADLEQACDTAPQGNPPGGRFGDAAQDLEERALAGSVAPDDPQDLAALDLEADI